MITASISRTASVWPSLLPPLTGTRAKPGSCTRLGAGLAECGRVYCESQSQGSKASNVPSPGFASHPAEVSTGWPSPPPPCGFRHVEACGAYMLDDTFQRLLVLLDLNGYLLCKVPSSLLGYRSDNDSSPIENPKQL
jgi:hypothetical protein